VNLVNHEDNSGDIQQLGASVVTPASDWWLKEYAGDLFHIGPAKKCSLIDWTSNQRHTVHVTLHCTWCPSGLATGLHKQG